MNLSLNIYQKGEIEKTYQTDTLHILFWHSGRFYKHIGHGQYRR